METQYHDEMLKIGKIHGDLRGLGYIDVQSTPFHFYTQFVPESSSSKVDRIHDFSFDDLTAKCDLSHLLLTLLIFLSITTFQGKFSHPEKKFLGYTKEIQSIFKTY